MRQVPGSGCALEGGGVDVDGHELVGAVGDQLAERGGVFEQARSGECGAVIGGCDLALREAFLARVGGELACSPGWC